MLIETMDFAVTNRAKILASIDLAKYEIVVEKAKGNWHDFDPIRKASNLVGIDSSWNCIPYQGFYIYAVDAVSMLGDGSYFVKPRFDVDLSTLSTQLGDRRVSNPTIVLASMGMEYELSQIKACLGEVSLGKADSILVDGSILARYYDRRRGKEGSFFEYAKELMHEKNLLFLSKTSLSNVDLGGDLGDMFYYNRVSTLPGYSEPHLDGSGVSISYLRLAQYSPCLKLEVPGEIQGREVEELMGKLSESSVDGYPYVLRLAHEKGKIGHEDMEKLANLLGLNTEIGGREVLGE